jgi:Aspartyl protease
MVGHDPSHPPFRQSDRFIALIDSGADMSMIRKELAQQLDLRVVDTSLSYGIHGPRTTPDPVYELRYRVEALGEVMSERFVGVDLMPETPIILGREFLANKIMIYDGVVGRVTLAV